MHITQVTCQYKMHHFWGLKKLGFFCLITQINILIDLRNMLTTAINKHQTNIEQTNSDFNQRELDYKIKLIDLKSTTIK